MIDSVMKDRYLILIAQVVECQLREQNAAGSKPSCAILKALKMLPVATWRLEIILLPSSNTSMGTKKIKPIALTTLFLPGAQLIRQALAIYLPIRSTLVNFLNNWVRYPPLFHLIG